MGRMIHDQMRDKRGSKYKHGGQSPVENKVFLDTKKAMATAMLRAGATYKEIQAATGLAPKTIAGVARGDYKIPEGQVRALMDQEEAKFTMAAHKMIDSVLNASDEDLAKMPASQRMVAAAVAIDKRELLAGRPTKRIAFTDDDRELDAEIERLQQILGESIEAEYEVTEASFVEGQALLDSDVDQNPS